MLSDLQQSSAVGGTHHSAVSSPHLFIPSSAHRQYHEQHLQQQQQLGQYPQYVNDYFPTTAPRYDSQYSLHEDVSNFLSCVRMALSNPTAAIDDHQLRSCIGFVRNFPVVDGMSEHIWGGPAGRECADSQQRMLLWLQGLQRRIEEATAKNLDFAAAAFGPCEEARRDRGVSGRSDVEAVRSDLEWWLQQHEELEARLKVQKEYLRRLKETESQQQQKEGGAGGDSPLTLPEAFRRANDLQSSYLAKSTSNVNHNPYSLADDIATLSRSVSKQDQEHNQQDSNQNSRSTSVGGANNNNNNRHKSIKDKQLDHLSQELLALQAATYRTSSIAETREKLVHCVLSLGNQDYGEKKYVRRVTSTGY